MTRRAFALLAAVACVSFATTLPAQDLLQSSCFQASFGRQGMAAEGRRIAAAELEWFDATHVLVKDTGALHPEAEADEEIRVALARLVPAGLRGRRFLAAQLALRFQGGPGGEGPESDGAICTPKEGGLRCRLLCEGAGEFVVRLDRQGRAEVRPWPAGMTLNACSAQNRRVRLAPKNGPSIVLNRQNYDVCGEL